MRVFKNFALMLLVVMGGCSKAAKEDEALQPGTPQYRAAKIADQYFATHFPDYDRSRYPILVKSKSDDWLVRYRLPDHMQGGTPVIILTKKDLAIVQAYREQ